MSATTVNAPQNPVILQLQDELARARECLAGVQDRTDDDEDALEAIDRSCKARWPSIPSPIRLD